MPALLEMSVSTFRGAAKTTEDTANFGLVRIAVAGRADLGETDAEVVLVIDRSRTMFAPAGGVRPIDQVIGAARAVVEALRPRDRLGIVTFDAHTRLLCPLTAGDLKALLRGKLTEVEREAGTGGEAEMIPALAAAAAEVQAGARTPKAARVVLLTTGRVSDVSFAVEYARTLGRQIFTALDFGGFDPDSLRRVCEACHGAYESVVKLDLSQVTDRLMRELTSARDTVATNLRLRVRATDFVRIRKSYLIRPHVEYLGQVQLGADRTLTIDLPPAGRTTAVEALFDIVHSPRDPGVYSAAEVSVLYDVPSLDLKDQEVVDNVVVEYTTDARRLLEANAEVKAAHGRGLDEEVRRELDRAEKSGDAVKAEHVMASIRNSSNSKFVAATESRKKDGGDATRQMQQETRSKAPPESGEAVGSPAGAVAKCPQCRAVLEVREVFCPECRADLSTLWANEDRKPLSVGAPHPGQPPPASPPPVTAATRPGACDLCGNPPAPASGACDTPGCPAAVPAAVSGSPPPPASPASPVPAPVRCSVFAPPTVARAEPFQVQVFAHTAGQAAAAGRLAREFDERTRRRAVTTLTAEIESGETLTFHLCLPGAVVPDPVRSLMWYGKPESVQFEAVVTDDHASRLLIGTVRVSRGSVPVGHVKFQLSVGAESSSARLVEPAEVGSGMRYYRRAFVSYASADRPEVLKRVQMLGRVGIQYFQDVLSLDPGARWERELFRRIDESDLFLLFWSRAARESEWVHKEVRYALKRKGSDDGAPPEVLPVVIEGPPPPPPPAELSHLHFDDYLLYLMRGPPSATGSCSRCGCAAEAAVCPDCAATPGPTLLLVVEGGQKVRWGGRDASRVPVSTDEILIGRKDVLKRIYPDVDLHAYHERGEGFVARRHALVVREGGSHYLVDLAGDSRTAVAASPDGDPRVLTRDERVELKPGFRVVIGEVIGFEVRTPES